MQACGVQGAKPSFLPVKTPALERSVMQSTSFFGSRRLQISFWSALRCFAIHGVLMFRPLPKHLDEEAACQALGKALA